jgi:hypothetical protein
MVDRTPNHSFRPNTEPAHPPLQGPTLEAFKRIMEDSFDAQKVKSKAVRARKQQERLVKQKAMADQLKRTQRYLGLRPTPSPQTQQQSGPLPAIDPSLSAPFAFDQSVVFVCVDVESYERAHHKITEVGVSTLDTRDLIGVPPGPDGENWRSKIRARHFRIKDHTHLVNREFVTGCPESFIFGTSTMVPLRDAAAHVALCFNSPFGAQDSTSEDITDALGNIDLNEKRNIVLLGHDTMADVKYLQDLGYDPLKVENILEAIDTATMYQVWRREHQPTALGKILYQFNIRAWALHNAGNDAAFTVQAMLAITVREATVRGSPELESMRSDEHSARLAVAVEEAKQKIIDEQEGWSDNEADGDGGVPLPIVIKPPKTEIPRTTMQANSGGPNRGDTHSRGRGRGGRSGTSAFRGDSDRNGQHTRRVQQDTRGRPSARRPDGRNRGRARGQASSNSIGYPDAASSSDPQVCLDNFHASPLW